MNNSDFKIIVNSLINLTFCKSWHTLSKKELAHICSVLDYPNIEDRYLSDNPDVYSYIHWDKIDKMQAIRIATRNPDLLNKIDLKKYTYKIKEIFFLIQNNYKLIFKYFDFDFANLSQEDVYFLFCLGKEEFIELIDIKKYNFSFIETIDIIRAYRYKKDIIMNLNYKALKNYQVTEILINTGKESVDLFDLNILNTLNWLELLSRQPDFIYHCNFDKFIEGDPFNTIQLIAMFDKPDLSYLLDNVDMSSITPFGWEKLLISKPDKFIEACDFSKLNENNWAEIIINKPELLFYKKTN